MSYQHGAYGIIGNDKVKSAIQSSTVVAYIGTAPIHLVPDYDTKQLVDNPIKLQNMPEVLATVGYSSEWAKFTLCEAFDCHFNNQIGNVGPIFIVNVLDPEVHRKEAETSVNLTFKNGRAEFISSTVILDTFVIADKVKGTDFAIDYNYTKGSLVIESMDKEEPLAGTLQASFKEVDPSLITESDIIGTVSAAGKYTGLQALSKLYINHNAVLNILAAPFWSEKPEVYKAMVSVVQKLNGHWDGFVNADIPLVDDSGIIDTIQKALDWADAKGYNSGLSKICWPQVKNGDTVYHLSTQATVTMLRVDTGHDSIPMESPSNKDIMCTSQYFGSGTENQGFDQQTGNNLNASGITTAVFWGGKWVLWGPHTAAFEYGGNGEARHIFDVNIRMLMHITNGFQLRHGTQIDGPMTLQLKESILAEEQENLDSLQGRGALLGEPTIEFLETANPVTDIMNGDFVWDISATPTPPFKSGKARVSYTDEGFAAYFGGES
jgi:uncharacterized protein